MNDILAGGVPSGGRGDAAGADVRRIRIIEHGAGRRVVGVVATVGRAAGVAHCIVGAKLETTVLWSFQSMSHDCDSFLWPSGHFF